MTRGEIFLLLMLAWASAVVGFALLFGPYALFAAAGSLAVFCLFVNIKE